MELVQNAEGQTLLHVWRTGTAFESTDRYRLYKEWNNIKFSSLPHLDEPPYIHHLELRRPLPYEPNTFDEIYCNHVLEHLTLEDGRQLVREFYRILKPGGMCRLVVPDLELVAREYLHNLEIVTKDQTKGNVTRYEWSVADMIDQMVRTKPGGIMGEKLIAGNVDWDQIHRCNGDALDSFREDSREGQPRNLFDRLKHEFPGKLNDLPRFIAWVWYGILRKLYVLFSKRSFLQLYNEINLWMYDQFSLQELMRGANFQNVQRMDFKTSHIRGWNRYNFDQSEKGDYPLEPSVYVEGMK